MNITVIWTLAQKELRDALRNRWFLLYTAAFVGLSLALSYMSLAGAGIAGFAGFGRTAASLINLVLLIIPLMALTVGAQSLAHEQEQGTLAYLLAQPVTRVEVFAGKYLGLAMSLLASVGLGFGIAGVVLAISDGAGSPAAYVGLMGRTYLLSLAMLSVGVLVSAMSKRAGVAIGGGLFLWLAFVFLGDLGLMGTALTMRLSVGQLLWLSLLNPLQVFKMAAILDINATLDLLGPAGIYAMQEYGQRLRIIFLALMAAWIVLPALAAYARFQRRGDF
ncbi:ABC transporter permease [Caldilinea sp.]|uniref:ABC transporter permease n=1 Tax=Caldilinea sp. TaxID=2293560 RepID=UPI002637F0D1|nr:ABC transporter permease [uncultured Caldilinea sp.]